jgi:uncharacterized membrane protein (DUF4010 family)
MEVEMREMEVWRGSDVHQLILLIAFINSLSIAHHHVSRPTTSTACILCCNSTPVTDSACNSTPVTDSACNRQWVC